MAFVIHLQVYQYFQFIIENLKKYLSDRGVQPNDRGRGKRKKNIARNLGHFEPANNYQRYIVLHSGTIEYQEQIFYFMKRKRKEDLQVNLWDFARQSDDMMSEF